MKSKVRIGASFDDSSVCRAGYHQDVPAASEMSSLLRSFKTLFSVMLISDISVFWLEKSFERYLHKAESFISICLENTV